MTQLISQIRQHAFDLGFQQLGISDTDLSQYEEKFLIWLQKGFHGEMHFMEKHGPKRTQPALLLPKTIRIISVRMDYLPPETEALKVLNDDKKAYISRYALGRDYHRLIRKKLKNLAEKIAENVGEFGYRAFCDSGPVLEKGIAEKAGLGWIGKHTNLINKKAGSWFFLGEIYTDMPLPVDEPVTKSHCGTCTACIDVCPTQAIVAPYQLDARRCIAYLTVEFRGIIPVEFRKAMGNRIYGCDDCQLFCPWNKFAKYTQEKDFFARNNFAAAALIDLFLWDEQTFLFRTEGSPIRRIGYESWQRNIAIALGNAKTSKEIINVLQKKLTTATALVKNHIEWALAQHSV